LRKEVHRTGKTPSTPVNDTYAEPKPPLLDTTTCEKRSKQRMLDAGTYCADAGKNGAKTSYARRASTEAIAHEDGRGVGRWIQRHRLPVLRFPMMTHTSEGSAQTLGVS